jgi:serine/threonine-protein kinase
VLAALVLAVAAAAGVLALAAGDKKPVPDVVGSSISVAQQRLENEGFRPTIVRDTSDKPRNTVIGQNPGGGQTVDEGSQVTLTVSDGPAITTVPDVVDHGRRAARRLLTRAGFQVDERFRFSDEVRINRVMGQTPSGRSQAEQGSTVTVVVSRGPERIAVPDVVGRTEDEARTALESAGFRVSTRREESDSEDPGTVLAQDPASTGRAPRGSVVTLTVAEEPKQIAVPDVVGRSQNRATALLSGKGFEVDVEETPVDTPGEDGLVQDQAPAGDRKADRGSAVTITVGRFNPDLNPDPQPGQTTPAPPATPPPAAP